MPAEDIEVLNSLAAGRKSSAEPIANDLYTAVEEPPEVGTVGSRIVMMRSVGATAAACSAGPRVAEKDEVERRRSEQDIESLVVGLSTEVPLVVKGCSAVDYGGSGYIATPEARASTREHLDEARRVIESLLVCLPLG